MIPLSLLFALQVVQAAPLALPDTSPFPPAGELIRLYTNCTEARWPFGVAESLVVKTPDELTAGVARRRGLEERWRALYAARAGDSMPGTPFDAWVYPLAVRGRLVNNYLQPRAGGPHEALDIFAPREGVLIRGPVNGLVIVSGDGWRGGWVRRRGLHYEGDGLSRRAGNGIIVFDPASGGYVYMVHMQGGSVAVHAGDVVRAGQVVGRVGHTGNASEPNHGRHLHFAFKEPGRGCDVDGVLVSVNPYAWVREARTRMRPAARSKPRA